MADYLCRSCGQRQHNAPKAADFCLPCAAWRDQYAGCIAGNLLGHAGMEGLTLRKLSDEAVSTARAIFDLADAMTIERARGRRGEQA